MTIREEILRTQIIERFTAKLERERELLIEEGDMCRREIDAEIDAAMRRFFAWLPGELQRRRLEVN